MDDDAASRGANTTQRVTMSVVYTTDKTMFAIQPCLRVRAQLRCVPHVQCSAPE